MNIQHFCYVFITKYRKIRREKVRWNLRGGGGRDPNYLGKKLTGKGKGKRRGEAGGFFEGKGTEGEEGGREMTLLVLSVFLVISEFILSTTVTVLGWTLEFVQPFFG